MRCIETFFKYELWNLAPVINYNMRCIETVKSDEETLKKIDKLQHEMY